MDSFLVLSEDTHPPLVMCEATHTLLVWAACDMSTVLFITEIWCCCGYVVYFPTKNVARSCGCYADRCTEHAGGQCECVVTCAGTTVRSRRPQPLSQLVIRQAGRQQHPLAGSLEASLLRP